jgi:hypothetical protein
MINANATSLAQAAIYNGQGSVAVQTYDYTTTALDAV